jgi:hypothetical protein
MAGRPIFLRSATKFLKIGLERVYEMDASEGIHLFSSKKPVSKWTKPIWRLAFALDQAGQIWYQRTGVSL